MQFKRGPVDHGPILSLGRLAQQGYWSDLRGDTGTHFFPDKTQTKRSHTQLHKEESLFFVNGTMVAPLTAAGVSDEVAQEIQMPVGPQILENVEEPMPPRPANAQRSRHSRSDRDETTLSGHVPQLQFDYGTWGTEALYR